VRKAGADLGLAWDGDYDRCFFFDAEGRFIDGYYLVGLLAEAFLQREPGARIVHDPRVTWNTLDIVRRHGGTPVLCKSGHAFIKQKMREVDAAYGGEMSAHHYFRRFAYCDSGMIPWLLVLQVMCERGESLAQLVGARMKLFPVSGEINRRLTDAKAVLLKAQQHYQSTALSIDFTDGLSMEFADGASTCAAQTPSSWCALTSKPAAVRQWLRRRPPKCCGSSILHESLEASRRALGV